MHQENKHYWQFTSHELLRMFETYNTNAIQVAITVVIKDILFRYVIFSMHLLPCHLS